MAFPLTFYAAPPTLLACNTPLAEMLAQTEPEELRVHSEQMVPVAAGLGEFLGTSIEPHLLIEVEIEEEDFHQVMQLAEELAQEHRLAVLLGSSGVLFNFSVWPDPGIAQSFVFNSLGSVWNQVTASALHAAFEDALRGPEPEVVVSSMKPVEAESFGHVCGFSPRPDGSIRVFRKGEDWEEAITTDSIDRAVELLLLFSDRCPVLLDADWEPAFDIEHPSVTPAERLALPLRAFDAVDTLKPGQMLTLSDNPRQPLSYGRNRNGQWEAIWVEDFNMRYSRTFDSLESLLEVVQIYVAGEIAPVARNWEVADDVWHTSLWTISAAELPDRDEMWREASVRAFHEHMRFAETEPSIMMQSFIDAANERIGSELLISEQQLEAAPVVTIMVAAETAAAAFERLLHLAEDRNISLVVNGELVLYNPSGSAEPERELCPLTLWNGPFPVGQWNSTTTASIIEAAHRYQPWLRLEASSPRSTPLAQRSSLSTEFDEGGFSVTLMTPTTGYRSQEVPLYMAFFTLYCLTFGVKFLEEEFAWDESIALGETEDQPRFIFGSSCYGSQYFDPCLLEQLLEAGLPSVSDWIALNDTRIVGDYCQVDRIGEQEYLIEWGHHLGEVECFQIKTKDFGYAISLLEQFSSGDRAAFESLDWTLVRS